MEKHESDLAETLGGVLLGNGGDGISPHNGGMSGKDRFKDCLSGYYRLNWVDHDISGSGDWLPSD